MREERTRYKKMMSVLMAPSLQKALGTIKLQKAWHYSLKI